MRNQSLTHRLITLLLWLLPADILAIAVARGAVWMQLQGYVSSLSPIAVGAVLGLMCVWLARKAGQRGDAWMFAATLMVTLVCIAAEHLYFYLDYCLKIVDAAQHDPKLQMFQAAGNLPVPRLAEYLQAQATVRLSPGGMANWLWWIIDAALTIVTAMAIVWWGTPTASTAHAPRLN